MARRGFRLRVLLYPALALACAVALVLIACAWQPLAGDVGRGAEPTVLAATGAPSSAVADFVPLSVKTCTSDLPTALEPAPLLAPEPRQVSRLDRKQPDGERQPLLEPGPSSPQIAADALALRAELARPTKAPRPTQAPVPAVPVAQPKAPPAQQVAARPVSAPPTALTVTPKSTAFPAPQLPTPSRLQGNMRLYLDIPYASAQGVDPKQLSLDLYVPEGAAGRDVVVFVHGGGWSGGDKSEIGQKDRSLVGAGYVFASVNYRLLPAGAHPTNARDVAKALAWIHKNVARYGGSPDRIFLIGHSAGAHLSGLVATDERLLAGEGEKLTMLKGVVLLDSNAYNIPLLIPHLANDGNVYVVAFGYKESPLWREASPVTYVAPGKGIPPFLVVHANHDASRAEQAESMAHALQSAGIRADLLDIPDRDHVSLCDRLGTDGDRATTAILDFFHSIK